MRPVSDTTGATDHDLLLPKYTSPGQLTRFGLFAVCVLGPGCVWGGNAGAGAGRSYCECSWCGGGGGVGLG